MWLLCACVCSLPRRTEAEEGVRERAGKAPRNKVAAGDELKYTRVCESEPGDYGGDEEGGRRSESDTWEPVFHFHDSTGIHALICGCSSTMDKVDKTMSDIQEQTQLAAEIQDQISSGPINVDMDEVGYIPAETLSCWNDHSSFCRTICERNWKISNKTS